MEKRRTTMRLDIQQADLASLHPVKCVLLADTWQIKLPTMRLTSSASTSQRFQWILSSVHFEERVFDLISVAQSRTSPTRTYMCERAGPRNDWNGLSITGGLSPSRTNPYSMFLAPMGWSGVGGGPESVWIHGLRRRR